jgi:hypothetical protein
VAGLIPSLCPAGFWIEHVVFISDRNTFDAAVIAPPRSQEQHVGFSV